MKAAKILFLLLLLGAGTAYYFYNKPVEGLSSATAEYSLTSDAIFSDFEKNEEDANKKYLNKVIEVDGKISSINSAPGERSLTLQTSSGIFGVICKMDSTCVELNHLNLGQEIKVKGLCTGMLMDVVLVRCVPVE